MHPAVGTENVARDVAVAQDRDRQIRDLLRTSHAPDRDPASLGHPPGAFTAPNIVRRMASLADSVREELRRVLLTADEAISLEVNGRTDAGVLVPLYIDDDELHVVFTKRREDLRRHPGEISFPGGRYEEGEPDLKATALREAEEEIGLPRDSVEVLGALQPTPTIATGYAVYPFVGLIEPGRTWTLSAREVAEVLELRLSDLLEGYARRRLIRRGLPIRTDTYLVGDNLIWGATARILADLFDRMSPQLTARAG